MMKGLKSKQKEEEKKESSKPPEKKGAFIQMAPSTGKDTNKIVKFLSGDNNQDDDIESIDSDNMD